MFSSFVFSRFSLLVTVVEGEAPREQRVQNHAARPRVDLGPCVELPANDFGSGVVGAPAGSAQKVPVHLEVRSWILVPIGKQRITWQKSKTESAIGKCKWLKVNQTECDWNTHHGTGKPKVGNFHVFCAIQEEVFRLQVAVFAHIDLERETGQSQEYKKLMQVVKDNVKLILLYQSKHKNKNRNQSF